MGREMGECVRLAYLRLRSSSLWLIAPGEANAVSSLHETPPPRHPNAEVNDTLLYRMNECMEGRETAMSFI